MDKLEMTREGLLAAAAQAGLRAGEPLTRATYETLRAGRPGWPPASVIVFRHGSWSRALAAAGLPTAWRGGGSRPRWSHSTCVAAVALWRSQLAPGDLAGAAAYDRWSRSHPEVPCRASVVRQVGSWRLALAEAAAVREPSRVLALARGSLPPLLTPEEEHLALGVLAGMVGGTGGPVSGRAYDRAARAVGAPARARLCREHDWASWLVRAGGGSPRRPPLRLEEQRRDALLAEWFTQCSAPTVSDFQRWRARTHHHVPSASTLVRHFGTWRTVVSRAALLSRPPQA